MKRFVSLDVLKYIACFLVINIHMDLSDRWEKIISPLLTIAVPCFFMITGFFYTQVSCSGKQVKQIKKIALLVLIANLVHIGWEIFKLVLNSDSLGDYVLKIIEPSALLNLLLFNQPIWRTSIWYINALLYVLIFIYLFQKISNGNLSRLYPLIPVLIIGNIVIGTYSTVFSADGLLLCYSRNFLLCGIPYFLLGDWIYHNRDRFKISNTLLGAGTIVFYLAVYVEEWILNHYGILLHKDHFISTVFLSVGVFCLFVRNETCFRGKIEKFSNLGKCYSFTIYVTHSIVIEVFSKIIAFMSIYVSVLDIIYKWFGPIIVLICSTLLAYLFSLVNKKTKTLLSIKK